LKLSPKFSANIAISVATITANSSGLGPPHPPKPGESQLGSSCPYTVSGMFIIIRIIINTITGVLPLSLSSFPLLLIYPFILFPFFRPSQEVHLWFLYWTRSTTRLVVSQFLFSPANVPKILRGEKNIFQHRSCLETEVSRQLCYSLFKK